MPPRGPREAPEQNGVWVDPHASPWGFVKAINALLKPHGLILLSSRRQGDSRFLTIEPIVPKVTTLVAPGPPRSVWDRLTDPNR